MGLESQNLVRIQTNYGKTCVVFKFAPWVKGFSRIVLKNRMKKHRLNSWIDVHGRFRDFRETCSFSSATISCHNSTIVTSHYQMRRIRKDLVYTLIGDAFVVFGVWMLEFMVVLGLKFRLFARCHPYGDFSRSKVVRLGHHIRIVMLYVFWCPNMFMASQRGYRI